MDFFGPLPDSTYIERLKQVIYLKWLAGEDKVEIQLKEIEFAPPDDAINFLRELVSKAKEVNLLPCPALGPTPDSLLKKICYPVYVNLNLWEGILTKRPLAGESFGLFQKKRQFKKWRKSVDSFLSKEGNGYHSFIRPNSIQPVDRIQLFLFEKIELINYHHNLGEEVWRSAAIFPELL